MKVLHYKRSLAPRLEAEFEKIELNLRTMLLALGAYTLHRFGKHILITTLIRTQAEQEAIYGHREDYQESPWKSFHQVRRAADLRYKPFSFKEWSEILAVAEDVFGHFTLECRVHKPGGKVAPHIHIGLKKTT